MAIRKTEGIILRSQNYLETSKIITCYGKESGKISLLAKGARRPKSLLGGGLDLLQHVALVYYHKESRSLQTLSQVDIISSIQSLHHDLSRLSIALAAVEFVDRMELSEAPNPILFIALLAALRAIEVSRSPELLLYQFLWRWLEVSGFKPKLRRCLSCGESPTRDMSVSFYVAQGGYSCGKCLAHGQGFMAISGNCIQLVVHLRDHPAEQLHELLVRQNTLRELRRITWDFLHYHAEGAENIKALNFLGKLKLSELNGSN